MMAEAGSESIFGFGDGGGGQESRSARWPLGAGTGLCVTGSQNRADGLTTVK